MRATSTALVASTALTGAAYGVVSGRLVAPLVAIAILVTMTCLVALATGVRGTR